MDNPDNQPGFSSRNFFSFASRSSVLRYAGIQMQRCPTKTPSFEYALQLTLPACPVNVVTAVMIHPGEPIPDRAFFRLFPGFCHEKALADRYLAIISE